MNEPQYRVTLLCSAFINLEFFKSVLNVLFLTSFQALVKLVKIFRFLNVNIAHYMRRKLYLKKTINRHQ